MTRLAFFAALATVTVIMYGCDKDDDNGYQQPEPDLPAVVSDADDITDAIAQFNNILGNPANNVPEATGGHCEIRKQKPGHIQSTGATDANGFSYPGVHFSNNKVSRIIITAGNGVLAPGQKDVSDGGNKDQIAFDDFFYSEPLATNL